jgi:hypothetical protein
MEGPDIDDLELQGVVPRMVQHLFTEIEDRAETCEYTAKVSMIEIYMERILDLLAEDVGTNREKVHSGASSFGSIGSESLKVFEDKEKGIYVGGATEINICESKQIFSVLRRGQRGRAVGATGMNAHSSRSHSIFILILEQRNKEDLTEKTGKLYLVDLAGSEKVKKTHSSGLRLDEAKTINKSLSALGNVINALTDGESAHVPYRDSKLTRVLQESLGGNSRTAVVINCSPALYNRAETLSTLRFGDRAKRMVNKAVVNEHAGLGLVIKVCAAAKDEIIRLQQLVRFLEGGGTRAEFDAKHRLKTDGSGTNGTAGENGEEGFLRVEDVVGELESAREAQQALAEDLQEIKDLMETQQLEATMEILLLKVEAALEAECAAEEKMAIQFKAGEEAEVADCRARETLSRSLTQLTKRHEQQAEEEQVRYTEEKAAEVTSTQFEERRRKNAALASQAATHTAMMAASLATKDAVAAERWVGHVVEHAARSEVELAAAVRRVAEQTMTTATNEWTGKMERMAAAKEAEAKAAVETAVAQERARLQVEAEARVKREEVVAKATLEAKVLQVKAQMAAQELELVQLRLWQKQRQEQEGQEDEAVQEQEGQGGQEGQEGDAEQEQEGYQGADLSKGIQGEVQDVSTDGQGEGHEQASNQLNKERLQEEVGPANGPLSPTSHRLEELELLLADDVVPKAQRTILEAGVQQLSVPPLPPAVVDSELAIEAAFSPQKQAAASSPIAIEKAVAVTVAAMASIASDDGVSVTVAKDTNASTVIEGEVTNTAAEAIDETDDSPISLSASDCEALSPSWKETVDESSGKSYYYNIRTDEVSWVRPDLVRHLESVRGGGADARIVAEDKAPRDKHGANTGGGTRMEAKGGINGVGRRLSGTTSSTTSSTAGTGRSREMQPALGLAAKAPGDTGTGQGQGQGQPPTSDVRGQGKGSPQPPTVDTGAGQGQPPTLDVPSEEREQPDF